MSIIVRPAISFVYFYEIVENYMHSLSFCFILLQVYVFKILSFFLDFGSIQKLCEFKFDSAIIYLNTRMLFVENLYRNFHQLVYFVSNVFLIRLSVLNLHKYKSIKYKSINYLATMFLCTKLMDDKEKQFCSILFNSKNYKFFFIYF